MLTDHLKCKKMLVQAGWQGERYSDADQSSTQG